jgi:hypothetical protein
MPRGDKTPVADAPQPTKRTPAQCREMAEAAIHVNDRMLELKAESAVLKEQYSTLMLQMNDEMPLQGKVSFDCGQHGQFVRAQGKAPLAHGMSVQYMAQCIASDFSEDAAAAEQRMARWKEKIPRAPEGVFAVKRVLPEERRRRPRKAAVEVAVV